MTRPTADERKATILDAVLKMIIDVGYTKMTVADVARVAGVSTALVHYHFSSKNELIVEALRAASNDDKTLRESFVAAEATALARLERVLLGSLPGHTTDASWLLWIETWGETRREPAIRDVMDDLNQHEQGVIVRLIADGVRAGEFECPDPPATADRLMALRDGVAIQFTLFGPNDVAHMHDLVRVALRHDLGVGADRYEQLVGTVAPAVG